MDQLTANLVKLAIEGDKDSLERLIREIQDRIYGLAIRMLWHPADAEDATQEILVKIVTHLANFRHESSFYTWCYRIASNHLLTTRKRRAELREMTLEKCEEEIHTGLAHAWPISASEAEHGLMVEEVMVGCIQGVLLCLDRELRITYILGEIFETTSREGAEILAITPEAFRKRLSRARSLVRAFMQTNCGLINSSNPCECARQLPYAIKTGLVNAKNPMFTGHPRRDIRLPSIREGLEEVTELQRVAVLFRRLPEYSAPDSFAQSVRQLIDSQHFNLFQTEK